MLTTTGRSNLLIVLASALVLPFAVIGCTRTPAQPVPRHSSIAEEQRQALEAARQQLDLIPPPSKTRYMAVRSLDFVGESVSHGAGRHGHTSRAYCGCQHEPAGSGWIAAPGGARRRNLDVRVSDLPTALNAIPTSAWPYGRVVAVEEAHEIPVKARAEVRRNVESVIKTLGDLGIVVYEWNDTGRGL